MAKAEEPQTLIATEPVYYGGEVVPAGKTFAYTPKGEGDKPPRGALPYNDENKAKANAAKSPASVDGTKRTQTKQRN